MVRPSRAAPTGRVLQGEEEEAEEEEEGEDEDEEYESPR